MEDQQMLDRVGEEGRQGVEPLRTMVEAGARADYERMFSGMGVPPWDDLDEGLREVCRASSRCILTAALAATPTERVPLDDRETDGTDAAHPAWWRGHYNGADGVVRVCTELLDGKPHAGRFGDENLERLAARLSALASLEVEREAERIVVDAMITAVANWDGPNGEGGPPPSHAPFVTRILALTNPSLASPVSLQGTPDRVRACNGDRLVIVGWDAEAYENIQAPCPGCADCAYVPPSRDAVRDATAAMDEALLTLNRMASDAPGLFMRAECGRAADAIRKVRREHPDFHPLHSRALTPTDATGESPHQSGTVPQE